MKQKEFDEYLRDTFEKASLPYNTDNWKRLSAALDAKREKKRRILLWPLASIAASIAMAIGIITWINYEAPKPIQANKTQEKNISKASSPLISKDTKITTSQSNSKAAVIPATTRKTHTVAIEKQEIEKSDDTYLTYNEHQPEASEIHVNESLKEENISKTTAKINKPARDIITLNEPPAYYEPSSYITNSRKPFVSMSGGLNYGTLNGGYVMGFAAGKKISERIYIEGDVAFVGNIGGEKTKYTFVQKSNAYAKGTSSFQSTTSSQTIQRFYNLYYAQFTPTVGYHLSRKLTLGVGADMQRLLLNDVLITETDNPDDAMQLPTYDMGLVGKTEYKLSKEIRASIYYRKAVNQALQGNNKLLNRDYLQVQLKFTILGK